MQQELIAELDKARQALEIRGSDLSQEKIEKIINTIKEAQEVLGSL